MIHSFNTDLAEKYGIEKAILLDHICYWIAENERNELNFIDDRTWFFTTIKALTEKFHYMSKSAISRHLIQLEELGVLVSCNFNKNHFNRTKWYRLGDNFTHLLNDYKSMAEIQNSNKKHIAKNEKSNSQNGKSDDVKMGNLNSQNGKSENIQTYMPKENKQISCSNEQEEGERKKQNEAVLNLPSFIDPKVWDDYLKYKKERKEKLTEQGIKAKFSEWAKWHEQGINVNDCINTAMANEWQGVFKPKPSNNQKGNSNISSELMSKYTEQLNRPSMFETQNEKVARAIFESQNKRLSDER